MLTFEQITDINFWKQLNPKMHITDDDFMKSSKIFTLNNAQKNYIHSHMQVEGYVQLSPPDWGDLQISEMASLVKTFVAKDIMPVFSFLFDEYWLLFYKLNEFHQFILDDDYKLLPDFWCWCVDPMKNESGWKPHRDKGAYSLFPDKSPMSLSTWIPLTNATTLNGCMYIVPMHLDRGGEENGRFGFELSSIRALPAEAGSVLIWNQYLYHWGSRTGRDATEPRISVAFETQRSDVRPFNDFLLNPLVNVSFNQRLALIGKQILQYTHMYPLAQQYAEIARELVKLGLTEDVKV